MPAITLQECGKRHAKGCVHSFADTSRTDGWRKSVFLLAGGDYPLQNLFWHQHQQSLPDFKYLLPVSATAQLRDISPNSEIFVFEICLTP